MSTMTSPAHQSTTDLPRTAAWRDALTPLSRSSRRRWTGCYALLLVLLAASVITDTFAIEPSGDTNGEIPLILIVAVAVVFGMLRRGTRRIAALDHADLDERDIAARNSAYRIAFPLLLVVVVAAGILLAIAAPDSERSTRVAESAFEVTHGWFVTWSAFFGIAGWIALWAIYLPTGVLAWREPDALAPEEADGGLSEPLRDTLLGLALGAAIAASLALNSDFVTLPFLALVAVLGGLAIRAGDQTMSRRRMVRFAIAAVAILAVVAIGYSVGSY